MKGIMFVAMLFLVELLSLLSFILYKGFGIVLYFSYMIVVCSTLAIRMIFSWIAGKG